MTFAGKDEQPLVSVCIITYNHEKWISAAIESVLMQKTDFSCELIIAEDCSKDDTRAILLSYAEKYPIRVILQEKNVGAAQNWKALMHAPTGKYVAYFEGDDSWIDPLKLKKQVAVLEQDETISVCYSNAKIIDTQNPDSVVYFTPENKPPQVLDAYSIVTEFRVPSCTIFFRNLLKPLPDWALNIRGGDHLMMALLCKHGSAYYIDECLGLYNYHYTGVSRLVAHENFLFDDFLPWFNLYEHYDRDPKIWESIVQKGYHDIDKLFYRSSAARARTLFWQWPLRKIMMVKRFRMPTIKLAVKLHIPFFILLKKNMKTRRSGIS